MAFGCNEMAADLFGRDDLQDDFDLIAQYIFKSIPSFIVCDEHSEDENAA